MPCQIRRKFPYLQSPRTLEVGKLPSNLAYGMPEGCQSDAGCLCKYVNLFAMTQGCHKIIVDLTKNAMTCEKIFVPYIFAVSSAKSTSAKSTASAATATYAPDTSESSGSAETATYAPDTSESSANE